MLFRVTFDLWGGLTMDGWVEECLCHNLVDNDSQELHLDGECCCLIEQLHWNYILLSSSLCRAEEPPWTGIFWLYTTAYKHFREEWGKTITPILDWWFEPSLLFWSSFVFKNLLHKETQCNILDYNIITEHALHGQIDMMFAVYVIKK